MAGSRICVLALGAAAIAAMPDQGRPRIRDLGVEPGVLAAGPLNAIADVTGVHVGHRTIIEGDSAGTFCRKEVAAVGQDRRGLQIRELGHSCQRLDVSPFYW